MGDFVLAGTPMYDRDGNMARQWALYFAGLGVSLPIVSVKDSPYNAVGDGVTDDTRAIQAAITAACNAASPSAVFFPAGIYRIIGTISWAGNGCRLIGSAEWGSELRHDPAAAATDMVSFPGTVSYNTWNSVIGLKLTTVSATNTGNLLSVANNSKFLLSRCRLSNAAGTSGKPTHHATLTGMLGSLISDCEFAGATVGTNDALVIGTSGLTVSTTVTIRQNTFVGSGGAAMNLQGSASAASLLVLDNIIEGGLYGIKASTAVNILNNHFEANSTSDLLTTAFATLIADGNNFQHSTATPYIDLTGGADLTWGNNVTDLAAGKILALVPAGSHFYLAGGPLLPNTIFPEGVINSGDITAMSAGALASVPFVQTGVSGAYRAQLFRGNRNIIQITGATTLSIRGGSFGGATAVGLPCGEKFYFELTNASGSAVSTLTAAAGDFPILGQINSNGLAVGAQQTIELTSDGAGNFIVTNSPGWTSTATGTGAPGIGTSGTWTPALAFGGSSVGITYGSRFADYYQIGSLVTVTFNFTLSSKGAAVGAATISGLPFAVGSAAGSGGQVAFDGSMAGLTSPMFGFVAAGTPTVINLEQHSAGGTGAVSDANFSNTSQIIFTMTYHI